MQRYIILIILLTIGIQSFSQKVEISKNTRKIVKGLAKGNKYETAFYPEKTKTKQLELYDRLIETASENELKILTNHRNGVVRLYVFKALTEKKSNGILDIVLAHVNDIEIVDCVSHGWEFVHTVIYKKIVAEFFVRTSVLTPTERIALDSILIFTPNDLTYTQYMLEDFSPLPNYYEQIRKLVEAGLNKGATIALAKYQNKNDLKLIEKRIIEDSYIKYSNTVIDIEDAIEFYPDEYFKNTLRLLSSSGNWYNYSAAAVYRDTFSLNYLNYAISQNKQNEFYRNQCAKGIYQAISKYPTHLFDIILFQLWENDNFINDSLFQYLLTIDSVKCKNLAIKSLNNSEKFDNSTLIINDLLNYIIKIDRDTAISVISSNLTTVSVNQFRYFAEASKNLKDERIIDSLFLRFKGESNGHICIPIVEAILSFQDNTLNERLEKEIKANENLTGWGLDEIKKIMKTNGIK